MFINVGKDKEGKKLNYKELVHELTGVPNTHINTCHNKKWFERFKINNSLYVYIGKCEKGKLEQSFPSSVKIEEGYIFNLFKISKADLIRCKDAWPNNPLRQWAKLDAKEEAKEYDVRFLGTLFSSGIAPDPKGKKYEKAGKSEYQHDKRKGKGRKFFNWAYGYPGRINHEELHFLNSAHVKAPVVFLDPNNQNQKDRLKLDKGKYSIACNDDSALKEALEKDCRNERGKLKLENGKIEGNFNDWNKFSEFILGDGRDKVEDILRKQQQAQILKELGVSDGAIQKVKNKGRETNLNEAVKKRITSLENSLKLFSDKAFFQKFTRDKGVLQTEQYFSWLSANIHAEITFLRTQQTLPEEEKFTEIHKEIDQLLTIRDFLLYKDVIDRDPVINITKKEARDFFSVLKSSSVNSVNCGSIKELKEKLPAENKIVQLLKLKDKSENQKDGFKSLKDLLKADELKKDKEGEFLEALKQISPQNIKSIKISTKLRIKEVLYNLTYYIPGSSLWLKNLHPSGSRVETGYKRNSLYCSNKEIEETECSKEIRTNLGISDDSILSKFVPSKHEAKCLISEFRKERNMMGAKERLVYKIKKNRLVWLPVCIGAFIIVTGLSIISRILISLGVITPSPINLILSEVRGVTESVAFIFGLDTLLDLTVLRALDFIGLTIRYVDQYLLGSMIRSVLRLITGIIVDVFHGIKYGIKSCWQSLIDHDLGGSLVIAADNVKSACNNITKEKVKNIPKSVLIYVRDKMFTAEEREKPVSLVLSSIPGVCLFYNLHKDYKEWQAKRGQGLTLTEVDYKTVIKGEYLTSAVVGLTPDSDLTNSEKEKVRGLLVACDNFVTVADEQKKITELKASIKNFVQEKDTNKLKKLHGEIDLGLKKLGNNKDELKKFVHAQKQISQAKRDLQNFAKEGSLVRSQSTNFSKVSLLEASLLHKQLSPELKLDYNEPWKNFIHSSAGVTQADLQRRINIIGHLIEKIENSKIEVAQSVAEPVFTINNEHKKLKLGLEIYKSSLEQLKSNLGDSNNIKPMALNLLDYQFRDHLSNAFALLNKGFNKLESNSFHGGDLKTFVDEFQLVTLFASSSNIKDIASNLKLYHGVSSSGDIAVKRFLHFAKEYQDPKRLLLCFLAMSALKHTSLKGIPETISGYMDVLTHGISPQLDQGILSHWVHTIYEEAEVPRDMIAALTQLNGTLCASEKTGESYDTKTRVKETVNTLFSFLFTVILINTIKSVAAEKGYTKKEELQKCYTPYFATIGLGSGIPATVFMIQRVAINVAVIYTLLSIAIASVIACTATLLYSFTLPSTEVEQSTIKSGRERGSLEAT